MFWKTKKVAEKYTTDIFGKTFTFNDFPELAQILEKASALQDQNRREYNWLFDRQNLILDHLNLKYVPETETKEPAKLVEKTEYTGDSYEWTGCGWILSEAPTKPKKKGRPKKK